MLRSILAPFTALALGACAHATAAAPPYSSTHGPLNRLIGHWVLSGTIAGQSTVHDVDAAWALQHNYVRLSEVSRERDANGRPQYEATIYVGWLESAHHYVCFWFDNTEVASGEVTCTANEAPDSIPLEFRDAQGALTFTNTFVYHPDTDSWEWRMDNVNNGAAAPFGRVSLRRK